MSVNQGASTESNETSPVTNVANETIAAPTQTTIAQTESTEEVQQETVPDVDLDAEIKPTD